jgi:hypothetical protein
MNNVFDEFFKSMLSKACVCPSVLHTKRCNYSHIYEYVTADFHETRRHCQSLCLDTYLTPGRHCRCGGNAESVTWYNFLRPSQFYKNFTRETFKGVCFCR